MRTATVVSVRFGITSAVSNRVKFDDLFIFFPLVMGWEIMDYTDLPHSSRLSGRRINFRF